MQRIKDGKPLELTPAQEAEWIKPPAPPVRKLRHVRKELRMLEAKMGEMLVKVIAILPAGRASELDAWKAEYDALKAEINGP